MLQRANSDAAVRLRRAKSTNSVYVRRAEGLQIRQDHSHAQKAALEAYRRAYELSRPMGQPRSTEESARKHRNRKSEGSHFEEYRRDGRVSGASSSIISRKESQKRIRANSDLTAGSQTQHAGGRGRGNTIASTVTASNLRPAQSKNSIKTSGRFIRKTKSAGESLRHDVQQLYRTDSSPIST